MSLIPATRAITSPSNLFRRKLCPGSARLESQVPRDDEKDGNEYSREGQLLHLHLAQPELPKGELTSTQRDVLDMAGSLIAEATRQVERNSSITPGLEEELLYRERTLFFRLGTETVFPGTCDLLRIWTEKETMMILDAKFGYQLVTSADNNLQLAAYAAMAFDELPVERIFAGIVQPRAPFGERLTMAVYTAGQIDAIREEILSIVEASKDPESPLHASPLACANCRAKEICPAYREAFAQVATVNLDSMLTLPHAQFEQIGDAIKLAAMLSKAWNTEALRRIQAGEMPGWKLKDNGATSEITDLREAFTRFAAKYGEKYETAQEMALAFMACLDPKWGKLDDLFGKLAGVGQKKARKEINELFEGLIQREEKAKSPVRA